MPSSFELNEIGRIPSPGDNLAIGIRRLEKGTQVLSKGAVFELSNTVLEGHRFAVQPIPSGTPLLSWGLPYGLAIRDILPGILPNVTYILGSEGRSAKKSSGQIVGVEVD